MKAAVLLGSLIAAIGGSLPVHSQTTIPNPGEWTVEEKLSPIDDSPTVQLIITSTNTFNDRFGRAKSGVLGISCLDHTTIFVIWVGGQFLSDSNQSNTVIYRIDKAKAVTTAFAVSPNNEFIGLWNGSGIPLIKQIAAAQKFFIRVTPYNESPVDLEFDASKLPAYLPKVRAACNW